MKRLPIILTIDPGNKKIGIAIFRGYNLRYWAVKKIRETGKDNIKTIRKFEKIIDYYIGEYNPKIPNQIAP